jgi:ribosomal protein S18 acetylase RimI-like enzyme
MVVSVRPAVDGDRAAIFTVHLRAVRETCSRSYSAEQIDAWAGVLSPDNYVAALQKRVMLVATDAASVVGFGQLDPDEGEVDAVYVQPERQGEGIGRMLLSALEGQARARGIRELELSATLNAVGFYERAGYARRRTVVHRMLTGVQLACVRMVKSLKDDHPRRR